METGRRSEEGKTKLASVLGVIAGRHTWPWRREPWAMQKTLIVGLR
jgi:hypothetical protein